jgi:predicted O-methyltransferase YrrM
LIDLEKTIRHFRRYNFRYFQHKAYDLSLRRRVASQIDRHRLEGEYPGLHRRYHLSKEAIRQKILPRYREYISEVSSEIMASSLELSVFLLFLCDMARPKKILDLGSGFSSFLFRLHALNASENPEVCSVDDSAEWLVKTGRFLSDRGLPATNLMMWDDFLESGRGPFDFIFYDLGPFEFRKESLSRVLEKMTGPHGLVILDDMHSADYGLFVRRLLKGTRFRAFDTGCYTRDHYSRYSLMLIY